MAFDKVVDSAKLDARLTSVADAIRAKGGTSDLLTLDGMVEAINAISAGGSGGGPYSDVTLLTTIEAAEDVSAIQIDWQETWNDYDYIFFRPNEITFSVSDWLYITINRTAKDRYLEKLASVPELCSFAIKCDTSSAVNSRFIGLLYKWMGTDIPGGAGDAVIYIYLQPYASTTLIKSGSKIDVLGVNSA